MTAAASVTQPPGVDLVALRGWFPGHVPGATDAPLTGQLIAGGKSNLTYVVGDGERTWIVRRPPLGHVLATAHDMSREYRVITALRDTDVPVPTTYALCQDEEVIGAPFYVMERVAGTPYRHAAELEPLGADRTRAISTGLVDVLVALHHVDPQAVGLGDFGRAEGYLARQVARWRKQLDASRSRDLPGADELHDRLAAAVPSESAAGIVHGDYRLDNVLTDENDRLAAVLDWEMATLGDPIMDLAIMTLYGRLATVPGGFNVADASMAPGYLSEGEILQRYAGASGRDLSQFGFYLGLAAYKLAAILEGIHFRYLHGQTVGDGFEHVGDAIHPLLDLGLTALKENH
ncbi:putative phosphotransferase [Nostocoides japonicum T1-X7]|uniref:Putative phosphotransferase n=1 Tax=Nostocoides japonicum T1-X7 TaxID=1194083 RepID=A0A077LWG4_9MICO|nr:phosphotransferase family protein [Tetrasphaera japonica]CCH76354.1 putative phosphotransferase [Tetrasphaera japonica T1-X7]